MHAGAGGLEARHPSVPLPLGWDALGYSRQFTPPKCGPGRAEVARLGTGRGMGGYVVRGLFAGGGFGLPMLPRGRQGLMALRCVVSLATGTPTRSLAPNCALNLALRRSRDRQLTRVEFCAFDEHVLEGCPCAADASNELLHVFVGQHLATHNKRRALASVVKEHRRERVLFVQRVRALGV